MHFTRVRAAYLGLCLFLAAAPRTVDAQYFEDSAGTASIGDYPSAQDNFGGAYHFGNDGGSYFLFDKMIGDGPGYTHSYQRFGLRLKLIDLGDSHLFGEAHALVTDDKRVGVNAGGGYRWLIGGGVLGAHGWFDQTQTDYNNRFNQTTFGLEWLSQPFDLRGNVYIPFGDQEQFVGVADPGTVPTFVQNRIAFFGSVYEEQAMKGFDAEAGVPVFQIPWVRAYAGGYYYASQDGTDAPGVRGRIEAAVSDDLSLNFMATNDRVFDTNYNLGIEYRFSGAVAPPTLSPFHGANRKYAQVRRQWPVATRVTEVAALVDSINPRTGKAYQVVHVDNTNSEPGDGSFENPFDALPDDAPGADLILVYTGTGSTVGNITLEDFQRLLGEGREHYFQDAVRGVVLLPESFGRTGPAPILSPGTTTENVVTLANRTEVNNFNFLANNTTAIGGMDITHFRIENINGQAENGIQIINASGQGIIRNFGTPGSTNTPALPFASTDTGIYVSNTSGSTLELDIETVYLTGGDVGMEIAALGGDIISDIKTFRGNNHADTGLILSAAAGSTHATKVDDAYVGNTLGQTDRGIALEVSTGGILGATMNHVGANGNGDLLTLDVSNGALYADITNGYFSNSAGGNGVRFELENALGRTTFNTLLANRNAVDGLNTTAAGSLTDYSINVINSQLVENTDDAIDTSVSDSATLRLFVDPTYAMSSVNGSGYEFDVDGAGSVLLATFEDTNLSQNGLHAVDGNVINGGYANLSMLRSLGNLSGDNGLNLNVDGNATFVGRFEAGGFNNSGGSGVDVTVSDGSEAMLSFFGTSASLNDEHGLAFDVTDGPNGPSTLVINSQATAFSGNALANVIGSADGAGSQVALNFQNTIADGTAALGGVVLDATNGGIINANWAGGSISNTLGDGIAANVGAGSQLRLNLSDLTIEGNAANGIDLLVSGAGAFSRVNLVDTIIDDNALDGFEFDVVDGGSLIAAASGSGSFNNNDERAWHGTITGPDSVAILNFNGVNGDQSGMEGGRFDVTDGGGLSLTMFNVNVTSSELDGILVNVDGVDSRANLFLDTVRLRSNGQSGAGDGLEVAATNGATVYSELDNMLVRQNRDNGLVFGVASGSLVQTVMTNVNSVVNGRSGLVFDVTGDSDFIASVTGGSFSDNGWSVNSSGVFGRVHGLGTTATTRFDGVAVDRNKQHGFDLLVDTGARLTTRLNTTTNGSLSASGNTLSGVRFQALDGGPTVGNIVMTGPNQFNNNGSTGVDIDGKDIQQMVAGFSGSASNNGGDGVNIRMENVAVGALAINGGDGTVSGNAGDGIEITIIDTNLNAAGVGPEAFPPMVIDGLTIEGNAGHGLVITGLNSDFTNGVISEIAAINNQGDGILVALTDSTANNLHIVRNQGAENLLNGINIELLRTPINTLVVDDNGTLGDQSNVGLTFFIDGDTISDPWSISNSSDPGVSLTSFLFDLSTSISGAIYNTETGAATPFTPVAGSDVTTGLFAVNGTGVPPYPANLVPDFSQLLELDFNNFDAGESFVWNIDADLTPGGQEPVDGDQLIGSTVVVNFSNGVQLTGALMAVAGNPDASIFVATGTSGLPGVVANNGLNGIRLHADDSQLANLSMSGNIADSNGGAGILIETDNGSNVTNAELAGNELTTNGNGGLVLDFDDSALTNATISDSSITGNTGNGILFDFDNSPVTNLTIADNPDIDSNTLNGISFEMVNSSINGLTIDNNGVGGVTPPPPASAFNITLNLAPGLTPSQIAAFQAAEARWESIITGDLPDIGLIDDLVINATVLAIDGAGGVLGSAGPTGLRGGTFLPFQGVMQFDSADLASLESSGQLESVILHEMGHVLGFGTIWDDKGLLINPVSGGGTNPRFTGTQATAESNTKFGTTDVDVAVEDTGNPGTVDAHWRETIFTNELMTGFLNAGVNPISRITIAQFADLGYTVDLGQADPYIVAPPSNPTPPSIEGDFSNDTPRVVVNIPDAANSGLPSLQIGDAGYQALVAIQQNGLNGINIELTNSDLTGGVISNNIISGHTGGDGVRMVNPTTAGAAIELDFTDNQITGNTGGRGVNIALEQPDLNSTFDGNTISSNGSQGVNLALSNSVTANVDFVGNTISNNAAEGVNVTLADSATLNNADFSGNTVQSNQGIGLHVTANGASTVALNLGATGATNGQNTFDGNRDAAVGLELNGSSANTLNITQTIMRNTVDGSHANFGGDGLAVRMLGTSTLTANVDGNPALPIVPGPAGAPVSSTVSITGNARDGVNFYVDGNSTLTSLTIANAVIGANTDDGIEMLREGTGNVDNVTFANNDITFNQGDGVFLNARNALLVDEYLLYQNRINNNSGHGVHTFTEADGQIVANIGFNQINSNLGNGILAEGRENDLTDVEEIGGDWFGNTITGNTGHGIEVLAAHGITTALNIGLDGTDGIGRSLGNTISTNGLDGIQLGGNDQTAFNGSGGVTNILSNTISGNGTQGVANDNNGIDINTPNLFEVAVINNNTISDNSGNGIQLSNRGELVGPNTVFLVVNADNNTITGNAGDGIEILASANDAGADGRQRTDIVITNSDISENDGRGLELLNRGDGDTFHRTSVSIDNTTFDLNKTESVYVVNTADVGQDLDTLTLSSDGNVLNNPILEFTLTNSTVSNGGINSSFSGTGLVMRVGTSGAVESATDTGGFVSNGAGALTGRGGVLGTVTGNSFGGNFGVDVLFESFTSTVDPTTGTTWDAGTFDPTGYQSDPLARFDLTFTGNTGDAADVTRFGAFYDNADPVFKSRDTAQTPAGPFDVGGARRRNAQRLAARGGVFAAPIVSPDGGTFLYPGVGGSTFRVSAGSTTAGFSAGDNFLINVPFPGAIFGELPFDWGSF